MKIIETKESENRVDFLFKIDDKKIWNEIKKRLKYEINIWSITRG